MLTRQSLWSPWRELEAFRQDVASTFAPQRRWNLDWADDGPAFNIFSGEAGVVLTAELPGFDPDSIEVVAERDIVTIRGKRSEEQLGEHVREHAHERSEIAFEKRFQLPFAVAAKTTEATYEKGVLTVRLSRPEAEKPQRIDVRTVV